MVRRRIGVDDGVEITGGIAGGNELGVHQQVNVDVLADDRPRDRVHEEGHVVGDDLDHGAGLDQPALAASGLKT